MTLSRGEAEGESGTSGLCRAPNPRTRYSLSNLYHAGMRGFERVATRGNKKCCIFNPYFLTNHVQSDVTWYKYKRRLHFCDEIMLEHKTAS